VRKIFRATARAVSFFTRLAQENQLLWKVRGSRSAAIAREMVYTMAGNRPRYLLNPEIYEDRPKVA
jgi:hypothetical protein